MPYALQGINSGTFFGPAGRKQPTLEAGNVFESTEELVRWFVHRAAVSGVFKANFPERTKVRIVKVRRVPAEYEVVETL